MLKRNLSAIRKVKKGRKGGTELSRDFFTHLQDEMDKLKMEEVGTDMIEQCIYNALENTYAETFEEDGEEKIVYDRLLKELRDKTSGTSEYLIRKMLKEYFDIDVDAKDKITRVTAEDIKKRMKDFRSGYRKTGFLMEYVEEVRLQLMESVFVKTGEEGKFKVIHSGAMQMKPDNLLSIGFAIDLETFFERQGTTRERNIAGFKALYEKLNTSKEQGYLVEISDKSYNLLSESFQTKGFSAQDTTLENFQKVLDKMGVQQKKLNDIMFALSNYGTDLIGNIDEADQACRYLATLIAYFVFDDINFDVDKSPNIKAVHIFNLNGIYVPLSVFLESLYKALKSEQKDGYKDFVTVTLTDMPLNTEKKQYPVITKQDWYNLKIARMKQEKAIHFGFLRAFQDFIKDLKI